MRFLVAHPGSELYGSDRVLIESAAAMVDLGATVTVALPTTGPLVDELERVGCQILEVRTVVLRKSLLKPLALLALPFRGVASLSRALRTIRRTRPDAIYISTITLPVWQAAAKLARIPSLTHIHEAERDVSAWMRRALYFPTRLSGRVIANSEFSRAVVATVDRAMADRTLVVYNGVPGPPEVSAARADLGSRPRLTYLGRLSPRKGADLVVSAVAELAARGIQAELQLVGDVFEGYDWYADELRASVDELGIAGRVRFGGFQPDIWPVLADTDILIVPSRLDEPFGNTAVEGLLSGRPVIASDRAGLREATSGSAAVLVPPDDPVAIADAVAQITGDWTQSVSRAQVDAVTAAARFSPVGYRRRIALLMTELTGHGADPADR